MCLVDVVINTDVATAAAAAAAIYNFRLFFLSSFVLCFFTTTTQHVTLTFDLDGRMSSMLPFLDY